VTNVAGLKALDYDGSNDNLIVQGYSAEDGLTGLTRYAVAFLDLAIPTSLVTTSDSGIGYRGGAALVTTSSGNINFVTGASGFTTAAKVIPSAGYSLLRDKPRLLGVVYDGSESTIEAGITVRYDGATLSGSTSGAFVTPLQAGGTRLHVGSNVNANNWWNGPICEYLVYNRVLSEAERRKIELYLSRKWLITLAPQVSNADAQDWVDRVYANGGTVSPSTAAAVNTFCNAIEAASLRDRFYRLNLFAGTGLNAALVPLYRGPTYGGTTYGNATDTNNGPFVSDDYNETGASSGLKGNGSNKYLNTGFPANTIAGSSLHMGAGLRAVDTLSSFRFALSCYRVATASEYSIYTGVNGRKTACFGSYGVPGTFAGTTDDPTLVGNLVGAYPNAYRDGVAFGDAATTSQNYSNADSMGVFCTLSSGTTPQQHTDARIDWYSIGETMTSAQVLSFNNALVAFQAALNRT